MPCQEDAPYCRLFESLTYNGNLLYTATDFKPVRVGVPPATGRILLNMAAIAVIQRRGKKPATNSGLQVCGKHTYHWPIGKVNVNFLCINVLQFSFGK
jgi:hypothetical protein